MLILQRKTGTGAAITLSNINMNVNPFVDVSYVAPQGNVVNNRWVYKETNNSTTLSAYTLPEYDWTYDITKDYQVEFDLDVVSLNRTTSYLNVGLCRIFPNTTTLYLGYNTTRATLTVPNLTSPGLHHYKIIYISNTKTYTVYQDDILIGSAVATEDITSDGAVFRTGAVAVREDEYSIGYIIVKQLP